MTDNFDRFGVPFENISATQKWAAKQGNSKQYHTRVPTREEVANLPPDELKPLLVGWMVHSPTEIIPSRGQIALVEEILLRRTDAQALDGLLDMCRQYVHGQ